MPTRNTVVLKRIVEALGTHAPHEALTRLEAHFQNELLTVVSAQQIAGHTEQRRLGISESECAVVLYHIAPEITIDQVEEDINTLFPGRFIEPTPWQCIEKLQNRGLCGTSGVLGE